MLHRVLRRIYILFDKSVSQFSLSLSARKRQVWNRMPSSCHLGPRFLLNPELGLCCRKRCTKKKKKSKNFSISFGLWTSKEKCSYQYNTGIHSSPYRASHGKYEKWLHVYIIVWMSWEITFIYFFLCPSRHIVEKGVKNTQVLFKYNVVTLTLEKIWKIL